MKVRNSLPYFFLASLVMGCTSKNLEYRPSDCLHYDKQAKILSQMVRYANKLPPEASHETKFKPEFNWYYDRAINESRILFCFYESDTCQLLVARKARSVTPMEEGIAIRVKLNDRDSLVYYEEVFRMWKMPADSLVKRGKYLFDRMVHNEDLTIYYSRFQKDRFIEFPDQRFSFDVVRRRWRDSALDTLQIK